MPLTQLDLQRFGAQRMLAVPRVGSRVVDAALDQLIGAGLDVVCPKPYPVTPLPDHIIQAAREGIQEKVNPPSTGIPEFRQAVANALSRELSISVDPDTQVLATSGGMHALSIVFSALLDSGDSVLVPSPSYFLDGLITPLGANIISVPMSEKDGFAWDHALLERSVTKSTKLLFLNTPVNPTGYVLSLEDLDIVAGIAARHDLLIVADESYDKLIYDGLRHRSIASVGRAKDRTILVRSFTKSYAMPNWRVGYIVAHPELVSHFMKTLEWMMLYGNYVSQKAATAALNGSQEWLIDSLHEFQSNRDLVCDRLDQIPAISLVKPMGGPFVFPNVSRLKGSSIEVCRALLHEFGVPSVPGSAFGSDHHIRIALGGTRSLIEVVIQRLKQGFERIGPR